MNWTLLGKLPTIKVLAPVDDEGGGGNNTDGDEITGDDDDGDDGDGDDDDTDDDDGGDDDTDDDDDDDDGGDDDDDGDDDDGESGKGAEKRIRKLNERMKAAESRVKELEGQLTEAKRLSGDDGRAILAAAEASGILPGLMTKAEAEAFKDLRELPIIIDRYQDWLDEAGDDDTFEVGGGQSMTQGQVKKRVRKLREELENLKDKYGSRRKELTGKVREILETGIAALKAGWKPAEKGAAKKKGKKKTLHERPEPNKKTLAKPGRKSKWGDVEDNDSFVKAIAAGK